MLLIAGPYYPLGTIGTVPRAYDIFRAYEKMEGGTNKIRALKQEKIIRNTKFKFKNIFFKPQLHYNPICEVGSV
jgi:hypothetical protein